MADLMKLTERAGSFPIYVHPDLICTVEPYDNDPENGSVLYVVQKDMVRVKETPEKVLNERRAALERNP